MPEFTPYRIEAEIEDVVRRFESCTYTPEEFFHARHLTVAAWYFLQLDFDAAAERMSESLRRFIRHHGKMGYHETITAFWLRLVGHHVRKARENASHRDVVTIVNAIMSRLADKNLIYEHYSRELIGSPDAKARCVAPDLKPLGES